MLETLFADAGTCTITVWYQLVPAPFHDPICALASTSWPGPSFPVHVAAASLIGVGGIQKAWTTHEDFSCSLLVLYFFSSALIVPWL